jgi:hypothetical protein
MMRLERHGLSRGTVLVIRLAVQVLVLLYETDLYHIEAK